MVCMSTEPVAVPTVGRIVFYTLTEADADAINKRLDDATNHRLAHSANANGVVVHVGNPAHEGDVLPMIIVRVWDGGFVNGQVFLDGNHTLWKTSIPVGDGPGRFSWPVRA